MQHILLILLQLVSTLASLFRPGGAKALVAENLLLKHQLLIVRRSRRRAPNLRCSDRLLFGLGSLVLSPCRLVHTAILIKPLLSCAAIGRLENSNSSGSTPQAGNTNPAPAFLRGHQRRARLRLLISNKRFALRAIWFSGS
jgi:hypothetical protein